jgi:hypothetical protein
MNAESWSGNDVDPETEMPSALDEKLKEASLAN